MSHVGHGPPNWQGGSVFAPLPNNSNVQLLRHFYSLPSTTVSCVRSFCGLRRLKTLEVDNGVRPTKLGYFVYDSHAFDRQALMSSLSRGTLPASVMREENCMVVALLCEN